MLVVCELWHIVIVFTNFLQFIVANLLCIKESFKLLRSAIIPRSKQNNNNKRINIPLKILSTISHGLAYIYFCI